MTGDCERSAGRVTVSRDRPISPSPTDDSRERAPSASSIVESVADGVLAVDRQWRITAFNRAAEVITGIPRERALGRQCREVLRANVCATHCPLRHALRIGDSVANCRVTMTDSWGRRIPVSLNAAPLRDEQGRVVGGVESFRDLSADERMRDRVSASYTYHDIVGKNARMRALFRILPAVAESESTTLIEGESGTGKELFAQAIHDLSPRANGPYVIVNCGALPEQLLESELFGYRKGAFTDAKRDKPGRFERASGGTLFLDEVGTLSPAVQVTLLRALEQKVVEPLGGTRPVPVDVRVISASNRSLHELVRTGAFRDDLLYRLSVVTLELPPLRMRRDDIPLLVERFVNHFNIEKRKTLPGLSAEALAALVAYDFPGNVRELQNIIEQAFVLCGGGLIGVQHLPRGVANGHPAGDAMSPSDGGADGSMRARLDEAEARAVVDALSHHGWKRKQAAAELGISTASLWRKMKRHHIEAPAHR